MLGRVLEVAYLRATGVAKDFDGIMRELLWAPLGMVNACFFLPDGDPRARATLSLYSVVDCL